MNKKALEAMYALIEAARALTDGAPNGTPRFEAVREAVENIDELIGALPQKGVDDANS